MGRALVESIVKGVIVGIFDWGLMWNREVLRRCIGGRRWKVAVSDELLFVALEDKYLRTYFNGVKYMYISMNDRAGLNPKTTSPA